MNILQVMGHLGRDPEIRHTQQGVKMTKLVIADNITKDDVIWWNCYVFGESHDNIIKYLKKGSAIGVVGEMRKPKIYQNKDGQSQVSSEMLVFQIKFSPFKSKTAQNGSESQNNGQSYQDTKNESYANTSRGNQSYGQSCTQKQEELPF